MFKWFKNLFCKVDGLRESVEDKIADVLDKVEANETVDEVEKKLIAQGVKVGINYCAGTCPLTDEQLANIADAIVEKGINKVNHGLSVQLRKK